MCGKVCDSESTAMTELEHDEEIDVRREMCPYPSIIAMKALNKLVAGQVLKVRVSSERSIETMKRQMKKAKGEWLAIDEGEYEWTIYLRRTN